MKLYHKTQCNDEIKDAQQSLVNFDWFGKNEHKTFRDTLKCLVNVTDNFRD